MTPAQIDTVTNGLINVHAWLDTWWPLLAAAAGLWATWWIARRLRAANARLRQIAREQQQMARIRAAIAAAPLIPTQPGHDDDLLDACWASWNATENRKEKPQP